MHLGRSHLGVFTAVESLGSNKNRKIKNSRRSTQLVTRKKEGTVKSCSEHYLPFKIISFERSKNIFDVSLHLVQTKIVSRKEQTDAEARGGTVPGTIFSRCWLLCLWTGGKQQRQPLSAHPNSSLTLHQSCLIHSAKRQPTPSCATVVIKSRITLAFCTHTDPFPRWRCLH